MRTIIGAITLTLAVPAFSQTVPAADPQAGEKVSQAAVQLKDEQCTAKLHMACGEMMKHHAKMHRKGKTEAKWVDAELNGNGHQGHKR